MRILQRHRAGNLESNLRRVDLVEAAVIEINLERRSPDKPANGPVSIASTIPCSTGLMNSRGMAHHR